MQNYLINSYHHVATIPSNSATTALAPSLIINNTYQHQEGRHRQARRTGSGSNRTEDMQILSPALSTCFQALVRSATMQRNSTVSIQ